MNYGRIALAALVATIAFFVLGFLVEGLLIRKDFAPYAAAYRSSEEISKYMPIGLGSILVAIFVLTMIFAVGYGPSGGGSAALARGAQFGLLVGIFAACIHPITNYVTMNLGRKLSIEIAISTVVQWTIVGTIIAMLYKPALIPDSTVR